MKIHSKYLLILTYTYKSSSCSDSQSRAGAGRGGPLSAPATLPICLVYANQINHGLAGCLCRKIALYFRDVFKWFHTLTRCDIVLASTDNVSIFIIF